MCLGGAVNTFLPYHCRLIRLLFGVSISFYFDIHSFFDTPLTQFPTFTHFLTLV